MRKGFTLIELMIVIAIIAIIAAIAIPNLLESRITANESSAATTLKSGIFPAQVQFQGGNYADDQDTANGYGLGGADDTDGTGGNGIGDYAAYFNQLAGGAAVDGTAVDAATDIGLTLLPITWASSSATSTRAAITGGSTYSQVNGAGDYGPNVNSYVFFMAAANERGFIVTTSPSDGGDDIGRRRFGINAAGVVYATVPGTTNAQVEPTGATAPFGGRAGTASTATAGDVPFNTPVPGTGVNAWSQLKK